MSNEAYLNVTRAQLARIFKDDPRLIKAFEDLFKKTYIETPQQVDAVDTSQSSQSNVIDANLLNDIILSIIPNVVNSILDIILSNIEIPQNSSGVDANSYAPPLSGENELITRVPTLIKSNVDLSNFNGLSNATLTNSPVVGNPTKWVAINDNGVTRYIPSW